MADELQELRDIAAHVSDYVERESKVNESNTKTSFIEPLLVWLGWNIRNPEEVNQQWRRRSTDEPVDYALIADGTLVLLIEAKPLHDPLKNDKGWRQLAANGLSAGFQWCARMNGRMVILVNLLAKGALEDKVFWTIDFTQMGISEAMSVEQTADYLKLLSKEALVSGRTASEWDKHQAQVKIDAAVEEILSSPPNSLINTIREQAGEPNLAHDQIAARIARVVGKVPSESPPSESPPSKGRQLSFTLLGQKHAAESWTDMLVQVCGAMHERHSSSFERVLEKRGPKWPWFSRTPDDVRDPKQVPGTDIYVSTHFSAKDIVRRIRQVLALFDYGPDNIVIEEE